MMCVQNNLHLAAWLKFCTTTRKIIVSLEGIKSKFGLNTQKHAWIIGLFIFWLIWGREENHLAATFWPHNSLSWNQLDCPKERAILFLQAFNLSTDRKVDPPILMFKDYNIKFDGFVSGWADTCTLSDERQRFFWMCWIPLEKTGKTFVS